MDSLRAKLSTPSISSPFMKMGILFLGSIKKLDVIPDVILVSTIGRIINDTGSKRSYDSDSVDSPQASAATDTLSSGETTKTQDNEYSQH